MIVREIKDNPDEVLKSFDWFNDYEDTRFWCIQNAPELVDRLTSGFKIWLREFQSRGLK
jgi:hypothetical protein